MQDASPVREANTFALGVMKLHLLCRQDAKPLACCISMLMLNRGHTAGLYTARMLSRHRHAARYQGLAGIVYSVFYRAAEPT